jgi:hypothetical protein
MVFELSIAKQAEYFNVVGGKKGPCHGTGKDTTFVEVEEPTRQNAPTDGSFEFWPA